MKSYGRRSELGCGGPPGIGTIMMNLRFNLVTFDRTKFLLGPPPQRLAISLNQPFLRPRLGLRAVAFSGDQSTKDSTLGTFNSLNEKGPYFTYAELFARRNLIAVQPSVELNLTKNLALIPNVAFYGRESTQDGLYSGGGAVEVTGQKSDARFIGSQAAVQVKWNINQNVTFSAEYMHFFPGQFIKQSTPGRDINYVTAFVDVQF